MNGRSWLYLEDDDTAYRHLCSKLGHWWKEEHEWEPSIERAGTVEEAVAKLKGTEFDVFLCDTYLPAIGLQPNGTYPGGIAAEEKPEQPELGLDAVRIAQQLRHRPSAIVGLSLGDHLSEGLPDRAMMAGADAFYYVMQDISRPSMGWRDFCSDISLLLENKGVIQGRPAIDFDQEDPRITWLVEEIGRGTIRQLYGDAVPEGPRPDRLRLGYLSPGMSGAYVFHVTASSATSVDRYFLLKISRDSAALAKELAKTPPAGELKHQLALRPIPRPRHIRCSGGGWSSLAVQFVSSAQPLHRWLSSAEAHEGSIPSLLEDVFLKPQSLALYYTSPTQEPPESQKTAVQALALTRRRRALILLALDRLGGAIASEAGRAAPNWEALSREARFYLKGKDYPGLESVGLPYAHTLWSHGDLHCRNILVEASEKAAVTLIDWSERGVYHWAHDCSRLLADLFVSAVDHGTKAFGWSVFDQWYKAGKAAFEREVPSRRTAVRKRSLSAFAAIKWILDSLPKIYRDSIRREDTSLWLWEFQMSLALHFLRCSYRPDTPPPKQALGLCLGAYGLAAAADTCKSFRAQHDAPA